MLEDLSSDISARPVRSHMGHLSRDSYFSRGIPPICARDRSFSSAELCHNQTDPLPPLDAIRRPRDTPIWKLEAALKCRSCRKGRYAPPVHMIKLTETHEITPYVWVHLDEER